MRQQRQQQPARRNDKAESDITKALYKWACAASAAGLAETATMPLDTTKTRLQLQNEMGRASSSHRGMVVMMRGIYRQEGTLALFRGTAPAVLRQALCGGIGVGLYSPMKRFYTRRVRALQGRTDSDTAAVVENSGFAVKMLTGATSGVIGQLLAAPTDVVKIRLQADARLELRGDRPRYSGTVDAFRCIATREGLRVFYIGLAPSLQRAALMYGSSIATYDTAKAAIVRHYPEHINAKSLVGHMLASAVSGLVAALVSAPLDTIKTRMISQCESAERPYRGMVDCAVRTMRHEGVLSLYKGFTPTYLRLAPWQLIFFASFERLSILMTGHAFESTE